MQLYKEGFTAAWDFNNRWETVETVLISQCCKIWKPEVAHCYLPRVTDLKTQ